MQTKYAAHLVGLDSEINGGRLLARGTADDVAAAVVAYDGELARIINVFEEEPGHEPHHVDQLTASATRTRFGRELVDGAPEAWTAALRGAQRAAVAPKGGA